MVSQLTTCYLDGVPGNNRDVGERFGSGRTPLFDSFTEDITEAFDRAVDRSVSVRARHSYSDES